MPASALLGAEDEGFKLGMRSLDLLRPTVAAAACGMAARALEEARRPCPRAASSVRRSPSFQLVQAKIARMATELVASRLLTFRAAWERDRGATKVTREAAMAKLFATEAAQRIVDEAVQILGGRGVLATSVVDRLYRAVRGLRIYEGTSEIQHLVIARDLLRQEGPAAPAATLGASDGNLPSRTTELFCRLFTGGLRMRTRTWMVGALALGLLAPASWGAAFSASTAGVAGQVGGGVVEGTSCGSTFLTHSTAQSITALNSISCNAGGLHTDNGYFRAYDMSRISGRFRRL